MILDTTALIDIIRGNSNAVKKLKSATEDGVQVSTTLLTVFELFSGLAHTQKPEKELQRIRNILSTQTKFPLTEATAERAGRIHGLLKLQGRSTEAIDVMIGTIALERNESVLTRNIEHFSRIPGLKVETY